MENNNNANVNQTQNANPNVNGNSNQNAPINNGNAAPKKSIFKRWWFWVIIGVVLLIFIVAASGGGEDESGKSANNDTVVTDAPEGKTDFAVGETINYDGVKITLKSIKTSKGDKESFTEPDKGKVFLVGDVEIVNNSDEKINPSWAWFEAYCDNNAIEVDIEGLVLPEAKKYGDLSGDVAPGRKVEGAIAYQVPKNWKKMEIIPKLDFDFGDEQNCKYVLKKK